MESLNFELEGGSMCHVVYGENCECIATENNDMWMQISADGSNVCIQVYPRNIEESYIGKECQENEELKYILSCRNEAEAVKCCDFFADFINVGYGDFTKHGKGWLCGLDLKVKRNGRRNAFGYVLNISGSCDIIKVANK